MSFVAGHLEKPQRTSDINPDCSGDGKSRNGRNIDRLAIGDKLIRMNPIYRRGGLLALSLVLLMTTNSFADGAPEMPGADKLKAINELPDPFMMNDGSHVKSPADWAKRREELKALILGYEYGRPPTEPTEVKATENKSDEDPATHATVKEVTLTMGPDGKVSVPLVMTIPAGKGPFPIIIKGDLCWGRVHPPIVAEVVGRGYILAEFDRTAIAPDKNDRTTGVFPLYPNNDWGALAAWAWGFGRVVDYAITRPDVDKTKIIATGHSRGGKAALLAGVLDERIALTAPNGSGAGGAGCFRIQWPLTESLAGIDTHFPYWFAPHFDQFIGHVDQLPFDQHEVKALIAPRALFTTDSLDDLWANPLGTQISFLASREVFEFLGAGEKTGLHYRHGKHDQNEEDFAALLDFADWQLMGKAPARKFDELPFPQFPPAYKWKAPEGAGH